MQKLNKIVNDWLKKFSTAEKNRKGFRRRERSKIGKDCQHTWKDLSGTTSRERLVVLCMAAITLSKKRQRYSSVATLATESVTLKLISVCIRVTV